VLADLEQQLVEARCRLAWEQVFRSQLAAAVLAIQRRELQIATTMPTVQIQFLTRSLQLAVEKAAIMVYLLAVMAVRAAANLTVKELGRHHRRVKVTTVALAHLFTAVAVVALVESVKVMAAAMQAQAAQV
jgi:hypothetical protein